MVAHARCEVLMVDDVRRDLNLASPVRNGHHTADDQGQHDAADDRDTDLETEQLRDDVQCDQHEDEDQELSEGAASVGGHRAIVAADLPDRPHLIGVTPMICAAGPLGASLSRRLGDSSPGQRSPAGLSRVLGNRPTSRRW